MWTSYAQCIAYFCAALAFLWLAWVFFQMAAGFGGAALDHFIKGLIG